MENLILITVFLTLFSFGASVISAIVGMGGGVLLLAGMYTVLPDMTLVLPLHACVSLTSNFTRVLAYLKSVNWKIFGYFTMGGIPGLVAGSFLLRELWEMREVATPYMMILVGCFILFITHYKSTKPKNDRPLSRFIILGTYAAPISLIFGANGAVIAPYFIRKDLQRDEIVATEAIIQFSVHFFKIGIFYVLWKMGTGEGISKYANISDSGIMVLSLVLAAIVGTFWGKHLNNKVSEQFFRKIFMIVLNLAALKILLLDGVWKLISQGS